MYHLNSKDHYMLVKDEFQFRCLEMRYEIGKCGINSFDVQPS